MVTTETLKKIDFMKDLSEPVLERIAALAKEETVPAGEILQQQGVEQEMVYMLLEGKVSLSCKNYNGEPLIFDELNPGQTCGISGLLGREDSQSTFTAVCEKPCTFVELSADEMLEYFHSDYEVGHVLMAKVVGIYKARRKLHSRQFMESLASHPAIASQLE